MPILPRGLSRELFDRVRDRVRTEFGLEQKLRPPANTPEMILMRAREAVRRSPPRLVRGTYQAADANAPTTRLMQCYSIRYRGVPAFEGGPRRPLLYAACEKDGWKVEAFRLDRFHDMQVTNIPFTPKHKIEL